MKLSAAFKFDRSAIERVTPIPLKREPSKELLKRECISFELRTSSADADSSVYELSVPFFKTETPEE